MKKDVSQDIVLGIVYGTLAAMGVLALGGIIFTILILTGQIK